jgi:hypothetical protein
MLTSDQRKPASLRITPEAQMLNSIDATKVNRTFIIRNGSNGIQGMEGQTFEPRR